MNQKPGSLFQQIERYLAQPADFPLEFTAWLRRFLSEPTNYQGANPGISSGGTGTTGIQFDTDNQGGYLDVAANDLDANLRAINLVSTKTANMSVGGISDVVLGFTIDSGFLGTNGGRVIFGLPGQSLSEFSFQQKVSGASETRVALLTIKRAIATFTSSTVGLDFKLHVNGYFSSDGAIHNGTGGVGAYFVGGMASGPPTDALAHQTNEFVVDTDGRVWVCTANGSPGAWRNVGQDAASSVASSATPTINTDLTNYFDVTALATNITSMTTNLTGTPQRGQRLHLSFTDNGTSRTITWGAKFESSTVTLPAATTISTRMDVDFIWNPASSAWRCIQVS